MGLWVSLSFEKDVSNQTILDLTGIRDYVLTKKDYLATQVGNPDGEDKRMFNEPCENCC